MTTGNPPGTVMRMRVSWEGDVSPREGDYLLFPNTGTCYEVLDAPERRPGAKTVRLTVVKLEQHEVELGQPLEPDGSGWVHALHWLPRRRRR